MEYQTVYTILDDAARVPWTHILVGLVVPSVLAAVEWRQRNKVMLAFIGAWALFWNVTLWPASWRIYHDHERAQASLRSGDCQVVEGTIEQFRPMPYTGHSLESFTVSGVRFSYSDFDDTKPGFNRTESQGWAHPRGHAGSHPPPRGQHSSNRGPAGTLVPGLLGH